LAENKTIITALNFSHNSVGLRQGRELDKGVQLYRLNVGFIIATLQLLVQNFYGKVTEHLHRERHVWGQCF
jgi:hypothetical protein